MSTKVVVGVGASAGGLEALVQLLLRAPVDSPLCYVVVQHLAPDHDSALAEILSKRIKLPVHQVTKRMLVERNHVYVIPPGQYLSIDQGALHLSEPPTQRGSRMAVDYFLRSLAKDACEHAIGILLSGTGSDGSAGLREIKAFGGLTVVQDPDEASHRGMPQAAIEAGVVDLTLPVSDIAPRLLRYVEHAQQHGPLSAQAIEAMEQADHTAVLEILRRELKRDFRNYRSGTISRRIARRMGLLDIQQVADYAAVLEDSREELQALHDDLLIGVTRFFRDEQSWVRLAEKAIKPLIQKIGEGQPLRLWSAGCATGEEAYTLAIVVLEQAKRMNKQVSFQIFASDLSSNALQFAREGSYTDALVADVPVELLREYFQKVDGGYRVCKALREHVVFAEQNVLAQAPFSRLDLIVCRNLLIYLKKAAQENIFSVFQFGLNPGGYLFLGSSESMERGGDLFRPINPRHRIYQRTEEKTYPPQRMENQDDPPRVGSPVPTGRLGFQAYRQLLRETENAVIVVDSNNSVLYIEGQADLYFKPSLGELSGELPDITAIARDGIKPAFANHVEKGKAVD